MNLSQQTIAFIVLAGFCLAIVAWTCVSLKRSPYRDVWQSIIYFLNVLLTRVLWRTEIHGAMHVPPDRGAIIICNHRSSVDPFFIQLTPRRVVHWFVAKEYFKLPMVGWFLRKTQSIPTNRAGIDTAATKRAIRLAQSGEIVGMLPEGRINDGAQLMLPGRPGAALVALKARVPVIPCYVDGAPYDGTFWGCFFMPARVKLYIGQPIELPVLPAKSNGQDLQRITLDLMKQIAALAGRPNFEPSLAGRRWKPEA